MFLSRNYSKASGATTLQAKTYKVCAQVALAAPSQSGGLPKDR
jgi:hypothetical protein